MADVKISSTTVGTKVTSTMLLLDDVTSTGAGSDVRILGGLYSNFSVVVTYETAAPTSVTVKLQGSLDNSSWTDLGQTLDVGTTTVDFSVVNKPYPYIRGNMSAYDAGSCTGVTMKAVAKT